MATYENFQLTEFSNPALKTDEQPQLDTSQSRPNLEALSDEAICGPSASQFNLAIGQFPSDPCTMDTAKKLYLCMILLFATNLVVMFVYVQSKVNSEVQHNTTITISNNSTVCNQTDSPPINAVPCGTWEPFTDEQCFKIFSKAGFQSYEDAVKICSQHGASLLDIRYTFKQEFLFNYLFKQNKLVDNVWIGAKYSANEEFQWQDGSKLIYTNWAEKSPRNLADHCVQMHYDGHWWDEPCHRKNLVVCQRKPTVSMDYLQQILSNLKQNLVPIGFIYAQLPNTKAPIEMWPWMIWRNVTPNYAGVFFRAGGGTAADFGLVQKESFPQLTNISMKDTPHASVNGKFNITIPPGSWSDYLYSGGSSGFYVKLRFLVTASEVRPRNMAIRLWQRIG